MAINYNSNIVTDGLVLCLDAANPRSYPGSGTSWLDLSGNGNNGTLTDGSTFSSANGGSISFDNTNGYITTTGMSNYSYINGITVSVWHYNLGSTVFYRGVVTNGTSSDRVGGFDLRYGRENYYGGTNNGTKLNWKITNSSSLADSLSIYSNLNEWHQYTATYNNSIIAVYKDGSLWDSKNHTYGGQLKTMSGSTIIGISPGTSEYLDGKLSIVQIHNRALSAEEVRRNYNATRGRYGN